MSKLALVEYEGILYSGSSPEPGASDFIAFLLSSGYEVIVVSNSSLLSTAQLKEQLHHIGVSCPIVSGPAVTAAVLRANTIKTIYALGTPEVLQELRSTGLTIYGPKDHEEGPIEEIPLRSDIDAVVIAQDPTFEFRTIAIATRYSIEHKLNFYAIGNGSSFRNDDGFVPGARALIAPIEVAAKRNAVILGKPNVESIKFSINFDQYAHILVIGNEIETDVVFANSIGATSILVVADGFAIQDLENAIVKPTHVASNLNDAKQYCL
jgi:HAD superfamily hydrolase (TIGR01450 family)